MKNNISRFIVGIWGFIAVLDTANIVDVLPFEDEQVIKWVKFSIALLVVMYAYFIETKKVHKKIEGFKGFKPTRAVFSDEDPIGGSGAGLPKRKKGDKS